MYFAYLRFSAFESAATLPGTVLAGRYLKGKVGPALSASSDANKDPIASGPWRFGEKLAELKHQTESRELIDYNQSTLL